MPQRLSTVSHIARPGDRQNRPNPDGRCKPDGRGSALQAHQVLRQRLLEFQTRELQQLNRLLQLRRHNEFLTETKIKAQFHTSSII